VREIQRFMRGTRGERRGTLYLLRVTSSFLRERVINKRTRTVKHQKGQEPFVSCPFFIYILSTYSLYLTI
jgi:hypothetical protein